MKSIEKLVLWLIPTQILSVIFHAAFSILQADTIVNKSHYSLNAWFSGASALSYLIAQIVIAIWLFKQDHKKSSTRWAWSMFGLFAGFWGLAVFLLSHIPAVSALFSETPNSSSGLDA